MIFVVKHILLMFSFFLPEFFFNVVCVCCYIAGLFDHFVVVVVFVVSISIKLDCSSRIFSLVLSVYCHHRLY